MTGQIVHPSHEALDMSDLSLTVDLICRVCNRADEDLEEPCPGPEEKWRP